MSDITKEVAAIYESILPGKPVNNSHIVANLLRILLDLHEHLVHIEEKLK